MKILIPHPITEKPEKEGHYLVNNFGMLMMAKWIEYYSFHDEVTDCSGIYEWYSEHEVSEEEVNKLIKEK